MDRLQKIIAAAGVASRRRAEELIKEGKVRVNGTIVRVPGTTADPEKDTILVEGKPLPRPQQVTYLVNKPRGIVCSRVSQKGEKIVTSLVPAYPHVYPVGRLDKESEGLILLTNNGQLANQLMHPSFSHQKEYRVTGKWKSSHTVLTSEALQNKLLNGVSLGDGKAKADSVTVTRLSSQEAELRISIHEGRNHLIRRMCAALGLRVTRLQRVKIGILKLEKLRSGDYRVLSAAELASLLHDPQNHIA